MGMVYVPETAIDNVQPANVICSKISKSREQVHVIAERKGEVRAIRDEEVNIQ
jgi:hypothetical protein